MYHARPYPNGMALGGESRANVRDSDPLTSPAVHGKCRAYAITQIYPRRIYYYNEHDAGLLAGLRWKKSRPNYSPYVCVWGGGGGQWL